MFLRSQHEDREDQLCSQKHLNDGSLSRADMGMKSGASVETSWEERGNHVGCDNSPDRLNNAEYRHASPGEGADQSHADRGPGG